ncbi:MAG: hypothetical protein ACYCW6_13380 [Candidatus Xenobia bacterium]
MSPELLPEEPELGESRFDGALVPEVPAWGESPAEGASEAAWVPPASALPEGAPLPEVALTPSLLDGVPPSALVEPVEPEPSSGAPDFDCEGRASDLPGRTERVESSTAPTSGAVSLGVL